MPVHYVNTPDGKRVEVTAPEGASQDEIVAYAQKMYSQGAQKPAAPKPTVSAPVQQPNPAAQYLAGQVKNRANAVQAFAHNFANPFIGAARYAINKDAESGGEMAGDMANRFNQWADKREQDYQAEVPNNFTTGASAVLGGGASTVLLPQARAPQALGILGKAGAGAANAAGFTALTNQAATGETGDMTIPAVLGGAVPLVGRAGANLSAGMSDSIPRMTRGILAKAQKEGIPVYPHQITDSKAVKVMSSVLGEMPFSGTQGKISNQSDAYTKYVSRLMGRDTKSITPKTIENAKASNSARYDEFFKDLDIPVGSDVFRKAVAERNSAGVDAVARQGYDEFIDELYTEVSRNGGKLNGRVYQDIRQRLIKSKNPAARDFRKILEENVEQNVPPERLALFKKANEINTNIKAVEKAMKGADTPNYKTATEGQVNPATFRTAVDPKYKPSKDLQFAARIGQKIKDPIANSGTAGRIAGISSIPAAVGTGVVGGPAALGTLAAILAGSTAVGATAGRVFNSPLLSRYLVSGAPKSVKQAAKAFDKQSQRYAGPLVAPTQKDKK